MSKDNTNQLIDERALRDALQPLRPDRDAFEASVRRRMEAKQQELVQKQPQVNQRSRENSPWLRVAASVVPLPLLGKAAGGAVPLSIGKLSLGYKLVGYAALPAISLLLMVGATLFGLLRIHKALRSPQSDKSEAIEMKSAMIHWWRRYALLIVFFSGLSLALTLIGYVLPVFIVFLGSGIAMVSMVTRLGRAGLIDRQTIGRSFIPGLVFLADVTARSIRYGSATHLLDQSLVQAVLYCGAIVIAILLIFATCSRWRAVGFSLGVTVFGILLFGNFARSLWDPMTQDKLKNYVETFDEARYHSVNWQQWAIPAAWLQESGVSLDLSKPRRLAQLEMAGAQYPFILCVAFDTELFGPNDLPRLRDLELSKTWLLNDYWRDRPISLQDIHVSHALAALGRLTESDRDLLESRLLATLREAEGGNSFRQLANALAATKLLKAIDRPRMDNIIRESVHRMLVDLQTVRFRRGSRQGGFSNSQKLDFSDSLTTAAAVELMQIYGVPSELDVMSLRSYLRPSMDDHRLMDQAVVRTATRQRLESLPDIPPLTWWDYARYESNLWMSLMVVLLCFYATLGSANRRTDVDEHTIATSDIDDTQHI